MTEAEARILYGDELVDRAVKRETMLTGYGWRVSYNKELDGEYEARRRSSNPPRNYWPKDRGNGTFRCRCRFGRSGRMCSHVLSILLKNEPAPAVARSKRAKREVVPHWTERDD